MHVAHYTDPEGRDWPLRYSLAATRRIAKAMAEGRGTPPAIAAWAMAFDKDGNAPDFTPEWLDENVDAAAGGALLQIAIKDAIEGSVSQKKVTEMLEKLRTNTQKISGVLCGLGADSSSDSATSSSAGSPPANSTPSSTDGAIESEPLTTAQAS